MALWTPVTTLNDYSNRGYRFLEICIFILTHSRVELYPVVEVDHGHAHSHTQETKQCQRYAESDDVSFGQSVSFVIDLFVITHDTLQLEPDRVADIDPT